MSIASPYPRTRVSVRAIARRVRRVAWAGWLTLALLGVSGCDDGAWGVDAGPVVRDAAPSDGGGLLDAGAQDAGSFDSGPTPVDAGAPLCEALVCDPRSADGCADGSCVLWGVAASCELEAGGLGPGAACGRVGECAPGLACFLSDAAGVCGRICCPGDGIACLDGTSCGGSGVLIDGSETSWGRCLLRRECDLNRPTETCEPREGCYIVDASGTTECRVAGSGGSAAPCVVQEDCQAGFFCSNVPASPLCVRICRIGEDDCRPEEGRCVAQAHTPSGTGLCTLDSTTARF